MQEESIACSPAGKMRLARQPVLPKPGQHVGIHTPTRQASTSTVQCSEKEGCSPMAS